MKKVIAVMLTILTLGTLVSCGFNEDKAKEESKAQLEEFLSLYEDGQEVISYEDSESTEVFNSFIESNSDYLTEQFISDTESSKLKEEYGYGYYTFYLYKASDAGYKFFNNYQIDFLSVDSENETVSYLLTVLDKGAYYNYKYEVTMIEEDGMWKINNIERN